MVIRRHPRHNAVGSAPSAGYDLSTLAFVNSLSITSYALTFYGSGGLTPDGLIMTYVVDGTNSIIQVALGTAWDVTTLAGSVLRSTGDAGNVFEPRSVRIVDSGTKMYIGGHHSTNDSVLVQYSLSTPYDPTTKTLVYRDVIVAADATRSVSEVWFSDDGLTMYRAEQDLENLVASTLSTAWDLTTRTDTHTLDVSSYMLGSGTDRFTSFDWKPDGTSVFLIGLRDAYITQLDMSTPWDLSTVTGSSRTVLPGLAESSHQDSTSMHFRTGGDLLYIFNNAAVERSRYYSLT